MPPSLEFRLVRLEAIVYRAPIATPVRTSFGVMLSRPGVLVRAGAADGAEGWGEIWCNFPSVGAEHRARLLRETVAPLLVAREFVSPAAAFAEASRALEILALQSGEPGPIAQVLAGIDIALWDLVARRGGIPLYRLFRDDKVDRVRVYASGLNPDRPEELVRACAAEGHRAFKLKIGFGRERDRRNLAAVRAVLRDGDTLMADANQAWTLREAEAMARELEEFQLGWLEEPLRADARWSDWLALARGCGTPLAAGENARGEAEFFALIGGQAIRVLQPDLAKWGGFSGCVPVARRALGAGLRVCPHWLGGGVGLAASLHLLAAVGGDGLVEVDANPNPLRSLVSPDLAVRDGQMRVPDAPGLGVVPDLAALERYVVRA